MVFNDILIHQAASPFENEPHYQVHSEGISSGSGCVGSLQGAACAQDHDILEGKVAGVLLSCLVVWTCVFPEFLGDAWTQKVILCFQTVFPISLLPQFVLILF